MKNKKRNIFIGFIITALVGITFAFTPSVSTTASSDNHNVKSAISNNDIAFPANAITAKCGTEESKTGKTVKKTDKNKVDKNKCGEGKCGTKDAKVSKKTNKTESKCGEGKCGEGKCGTKDAKMHKKTEKQNEKSKKTDAKCGQGKCGVA